MKILASNDLRWIFQVRPKQDELLSSWLVRSAIVQLTKIHTFCSSNWPSIEFWNRDIDRFTDTLILEVLASKTSTSITAALNTSLESYSGKLFIKDAKTFNVYLLPWGIWHRKRKLPGLLFCPSCLELDAPYFRKIWRVSLSFCCVKCKILLLDRCEFCNSPIAFFRNDFISKSDIPRRKIDHCNNCGISLTLCSRSKASESLVKLQLSLEKYIAIGFLNYKKKSFFDVVLHIQWCLYSKSKRLIRFQDYVRLHNPFLNDYDLGIETKLNIFLLRSIEQRRIVFQLAHWVLNSFPQRINKILLSSGTTVKALIGEKKNLPEWFLKELNKNPF